MTVSKSGGFASHLLESLPLVSSKQRGLPVLALPYCWPQDLFFSWFSKLPHFSPDFCPTQSLFLLNAWLFIFKEEMMLLKKKILSMRFVLNMEPWPPWGGTSLKVSMIRLQKVTPHSTPDFYTGKIRIK